MLRGKELRPRSSRVPVSSLQVQSQLQSALRASVEVRHRSPIQYTLLEEAGVTLQFYRLQLDLSGMVSYEE